MAKRLNREAMIEKLDRIVFERDGERAMEGVERLDMAGALLTIADLDHGHQYDLCRMVAAHLLGRVPEPDDVDPGEV